MADVEQDTGNEPDAEALELRTAPSYRLVLWIIALLLAALVAFSAVDWLGADRYGQHCRDVGGTVRWNTAGQRVCDLDPQVSRTGGRFGDEDWRIGG